LVEIHALLALRPSASKRACNVCAKFCWKPIENWHLQASQKRLNWSRLT